jgi:hypothetical protein
MDRKEMAEGAMAPKCECQQPGTEGVQGRDGCPRTRVEEKSHEGADMNVIELDGRWHVIEGGAVLHVAETNAAAWRWVDRHSGSQSPALNTLRSGYGIKSSTPREFNQRDSEFNQRDSIGC